MASGATNNLGGSVNLTLPSMNVATPQNTSGTSNLDTNSPFYRILNSLAKNIAPMQGYMKTNPYEKFAAPYQALAQNFVNTTVRPQFEQNYLNPFNAQQKAVAAAGNAMMNPMAQQNYNKNLNALYQTNYYPVEQQVQNTLEQLARQFYNQALTENYTSPTAFTNLGK